MDDKRDHEAERRPRERGGRAVSNVDYETLADHARIERALQVRQLSRERDSACRESSALLHVVKGVHAALADSGTVVVPTDLEADLEDAVRGLVAERDESRAALAEARWSWRSDENGGEMKDTNTGPFTAEEIADARTASVAPGAGWREKALARAVLRVAGEHENEGAGESVADDALQAEFVAWAVAEGWPRMTTRALVALDGEPPAVRYEDARTETLWRAYRAGAQRDGVTA